MNTLYDYYPAVISNLRKARRKWSRMSRILGQEGADAWNSIKFYKAVVQAILFFISQT